LNEQVGLRPSYLSHNSKSPPKIAADVAFADKIVRPHKQPASVAFVERNEPGSSPKPAATPIAAITPRQRLPSVGKNGIHGVNRIK
jgi:hypothetical protein